MKKITRLMFVSLFFVFGSPAYSDSGMAIQIFECEFNGDATSKQLLEVTAAWLKAAKNTDGGKDIDVGIRFPIAEGGDAGGDFRFVISLPNFAAWGKFTDAYEGSEVEGVDEQLYEIADCGESTIWEGMVIK